MTSKCLICPVCGGDGLWCSGEQDDVAYWVAGTTGTCGECGARLVAVWCTDEDGGLWVVAEEAGEGEERWSPRAPCPQCHMTGSHKMDCTRRAPW